MLSLVRILSIICLIISLFCVVGALNITMSTGNDQIGNDYNNTNSNSHSIIGAITAKRSGKNVVIINHHDHSHHHYHATAPNLTNNNTVTTQQPLASLPPHLALPRLDARTLNSFRAPRSGSYCHYGAVGGQGSVSRHPNYNNRYIPSPVIPSYNNLATNTSHQRYHPYHPFNPRQATIPSLYTSYNRYPYRTRARAPQRMIHQDAEIKKLKVCNFHRLANSNSTHLHLISITSG